MRINDRTGSDAQAQDLEDLQPEPIPDDIDDDETGTGEAETDDTEVDDASARSDNQDWQNDGEIVLPRVDEQGRQIEYFDEDTGRPVSYEQAQKWASQAHQSAIEPEPEPAPRPAPEPELPPYVPPRPTFMTAAMEEAERQRINDLSLTDFAAAHSAMSAFEEKQRNQAEQVTRWRRGEIDRKYPEFAREHSLMLEQGLQMLQPAQRAEDSAELFAVFQAIGTEVMAHPKKDLVAVLKRNIALMEGKPQTQATAPVRPALRPAQRNTPATVTVAATRQPAAIRGSGQRNRSTLSPGAQILKDSGMHTGLTDAEYERAASAMKSGSKR